MSRIKNITPARIGLAVLLFLLVSEAQPTLLRGQSQTDLAELKKKVGKLLEQTKYTEAAPLLEKIVAAEPDDPDNHYYLAAALLGLAATAKDENARRQINLRARSEFIKAKELGSRQPNIDAMIQMIPADGGTSGSFSSNTDAEKLMSEGEKAFSRGQLDDAFKDYQKALALDPKLYYAALFSGDVKMQQNNLAQAEVWYQRAIQIDPYKETAYRYSATPLMKQEKYDEALARYIEAYITEPYNRFTTAGLVQWARATKNTLAHPNVEIPTDLEFDEKGDAQLTDIDPVVIVYAATRSAWHKEKFRQTFPNASRYRHTLAEEADALRSVIASATAKSSAKTDAADPSLLRLKKLDNEGLLEAYILLARHDAGIRQDHPSYLHANRDKLRRYMTDYVAKGGGN